MYSTVLESNLWELKIEQNHKVENSIHDKKRWKYLGCWKSFITESQELSTSNTKEKKKKSGFFFYSYWFEWIPVKYFDFQINVLVSLAGKIIVTFIPKPPGAKQNKT